MLAYLRYVGAVLDALGVGISSVYRVVPGVGAAVPGDRIFHCSSRHVVIGYWAMVLVMT